MQTRIIDLDPNPLTMPPINHKDGKEKRREKRAKKKVNKFGIIK